MERADMELKQKCRIEVQIISFVWTSDWALDVLKKCDRSISAALESKLGQETGQTSAESAAGNDISVVAHLLLTVGSDRLFL
jgi:hypothetical protein